MFDRKKNENVFTEIHFENRSTANYCSIISTVLHKDEHESQDRTNDSYQGLASGLMNFLALGVTKPYAATCLEIAFGLKEAMSTCKTVVFLGNDMGVQPACVEIRKTFLSSSFFVPANSAGTECRDRTDRTARTSPKRSALSECPRSALSRTGGHAHTRTNPKARWQRPRG